MSGLYIELKTHSRNAATRGKNKNCKQATPGHTAHYHNHLSMENMGTGLIRTPECAAL